MADPILAAIASARAAWHAVDDKCFDAVGGEKAWDAVEEAAFERLCATAPTTTAGMVALCDYISEEAEGSIYDDRYVRILAPLRNGLAAIGGDA